MTQVPEGWYPDPAPRENGEPQRVRWWDGRVWTQHVAPAAAVEEPIRETPGFWARLLGRRTSRS